MAECQMDIFDSFSINLLITNFFPSNRSSLLYCLIVSCATFVYPLLLSIFDVPHPIWLVKSFFSGVHIKLFGKSGVIFSFSIASVPSNSGKSSSITFFFSVIKLPVALIGNNSTNSALIISPLLNLSLVSVSISLYFNCFHSSHVTLSSISLHCFNDIVGLAAPEYTSRSNWISSFLSSSLLSAISP